MDENRVFSTRHSLRLLFILCLVIKLKWCYSFIYTHANTYTERIYKISIYYRWSTSNIGTRTIVAIVSRVRWHSWQWYRWRDRIKKIEAKSEFHGVLRTHTMRQHTKLFRVSHFVFFFFSFALSDSKFTIQSGIRMEQITHDFTIVGLCDTTLALHAQHEIRMESYIGFTMITRFFV